MAEKTGYLNVAVAEPLSASSDLNVAISDRATVILEPDRPKLLALEVPTLNQTSQVTVASPVVDFEAQGVGRGDVLEITSGPNRGHYVVRDVWLNTLTVYQSFNETDATAMTAVVRVQRETTAYRTAALVISQPSYNPGFRVDTSVDISVI